MSEIERVAEECLECGMCVGTCDFLTEYCENPREYAERILDGELAELAEIAFYCNICGYCALECPEAIDLAKFFLEVRAKAVDEGVKIPRNLQFLKATQKYVNSDAFVLNLSNDEEPCDQAFFPGCHLSGYSSDLVLQTYGFLREKIPGMGIVLQCCGAPDLDTGNQEAYKETMDRLAGTLKKMGVNEIVAACPNCIYHFKHYAPEVKVTNLYTVMAEYWPAESGMNGKGTYSVHDPCKARAEDEMRQTAEVLMQRAGFTVEHPAESGEETRCCGQGGLVPYASMKFAGELSRQRAEDLGEQIVTYCASCREAFAPYKSSVHLLDMLFNAKNLQETAQKPAHKPSEVKKNQAMLKERLLEIYGNGG